MDTQTAVAVLLRRWWLIAALPLAVLVGSIVVTANPPYVATVRATILFPGDLETPGNAERPELMVLDDTPTLVGSRVFADAVATRVRSISPSLNLTSEDVAQALSAKRYSRVLSVQARHHSARDAMAIASAVSAVLPDAINSYLVATNAQPATVNIIDRPRRAIPDVGDRALIISIQTAVALFVGIGLAFLAASLDDRLFAGSDVEAALGLPVLADFRPARHISRPSVLSRVPHW